MLLPRCHSRRWRGMHSSELCSVSSAFQMKRNVNGRVRAVEDGQCAPAVPATSLEALATVPPCARRGARKSAGQCRQTRAKPWPLSRWPHKALFWRRPMPPRSPPRPTIGTCEPPGTTCRAGTDVIGPPTQKTPLSAPDAPAARDSPPANGTGPAATTANDGAARWQIMGLDATPELLAIFLVYFVQGILGLSRLAVSYYFKDDLGMDPAELAIFQGFTALPWLIKPIYGFASDTFPILGYRRRSYLVLCGLLGSLAWTSMFLLHPGAPLATVFLVAGSAGTACSDVVVDSIVVEASRGKPASVAGAPAVSSALVAFGVALSAASAPAPHATDCSLLASALRGSLKAHSYVRHAAAGQFAPICATITAPRGARACRLVPEPQLGLLRHRRHRERLLLGLAHRALRRRLRLWHHRGLPAASCGLRAAHQRGARVGARAGGGQEGRGRRRRERRQLGRGVATKVGGGCAGAPPLVLPLSTSQQAPHRSA